MACIPLILIKKTMSKILLNIKKCINLILLVLYRPSIRFKLRKNKNSFDSSNYFYGGNNICIINTKWGKHSGIGGYAEIIDTLVGNFTNISSWAKIGIGDHIHTNFLICDFVYKDNDHIMPPGISSFEDYWVKIGNDVWVGANVTILRGVEVGDGAVIAAGSVVTKSIPPYAIVGGNPAKFIKWRFPFEVREKLLEIKWWDWDDDLIKEKKDYLQNLVGFDMDKYKIEYRKRKEDLFY